MSHKENSKKTSQNRSFCITDHCAKLIWVDRPRTKNVEALKQWLNTNNFLFLIGFSFFSLFFIINFDNFEQTNVFANAQKRKVRPFEGMQRKAIVIVPSEEDYKARTEAQEKAECKDVPDNAVMEMKGII